MQVMHKFSSHSNIVPRAWIGMDRETCAAGLSISALPCTHSAIDEMVEVEWIGFYLQELETARGKYYHAAVNWDFR